MRWKRIGSCPSERCKGRCCENVNLWFPADPEFLEWTAVRGLAILRVDEQALVTIPQRCQHLTEHGLCRLHPDMGPGPELPIRPQLCNDWPTHPSQILVTDCDFDFIEVND